MRMVPDLDLRHPLPVIFSRRLSVVRVPRLYRKRMRQVCMSRADNVWFTEILREAISPLEFLLIDEEEKRIEQVDSLAGHDDFVMITSPEPGGATMKQLRRALRLSDDCVEEPFRSTLPSSAVLYIPHEEPSRTRTRRDGGGRSVEIFFKSPFHFVYRRDDPVAHAFASKFMRLIGKHLIHRFVVVNCETGEIVMEVPKGAGLWAGPDVVESCRRIPHRYICPVYSGTDVKHCFAPMPAE